MTLSKCMESLDIEALDDDDDGKDNIKDNINNNFSLLLLSDESFCNQHRYTLVQTNGHRVLGPPSGWNKPVPTSACELFVRCVFRYVNEANLIGQFWRFGQIYEIRLPLNFNQMHRGCAYVKYTNEEDAACAMEVLNHYFISRGVKLEVRPCSEKRRFFVSDIPLELTETEIEEKLRTIFPAMQRILIPNYGSGINGDDVFDCGQSQMASTRNYGYCFVWFPTHDLALEAMKKITLGIIKIWGRNVKVVWDNPTTCTSEFSMTNTTLFIRNVASSVRNHHIINLLVHFVSRTMIRKITMIRSSVFCNFTSRGAAEICKRQLQGIILHGERLNVDWARSYGRNNPYRARNVDFDAILRLKCIANSWKIPIVIFGAYFKHQSCQYGAVVLRNSNGLTRAVFLIMSSRECIDIQSRMCEVVCELIDHIGTFPDYNYVFDVKGDRAHLVGMVVHGESEVHFMASTGVPAYIYLDINEIVDLSSGIAMLASFNETQLLKFYYKSFRSNTKFTYLRNCNMMNDRIFGTIMPKYRNKPVLKYGLNDTQIVLALCFVVTGTNQRLSSRTIIITPASTFCSRHQGLPYICLKLVPNHLLYSRHSINHIFSHVLFGNIDYYHPTQSKVKVPVWMNGCSYDSSVKQPNYRV